MTEQRPKVDWAQRINDLVDERYPEAERMVLVMDNLTAHKGDKVRWLIEARG